MYYILINILNKMMTHVECTKQIVKFKTLMAKASLCDYCDVYIFVIKGTIPVVGVVATEPARQTGRKD